MPPEEGILLMEKVVFFTDLDRTLLDAATYSFDAAGPALALLAEKHVQLCIVSSKTRSEIVRYRGRLRNHHPFIAENGGGIYIPHGYFDPPPEEAENEGDFHLIRLGAHYGELRHAIVRLRESGFKVRGFGDMSADEIIAATGIPADEAPFAKEREFDEPFVSKVTDEGALRGAIEAMGFRYTKGALHHITGASDKGRAVTILRELYERQFGPVVTVAFGDSPNDLPMLEAADIAVLVRQPDGSHHPGVKLPGHKLLRAGGAGPEGWNHAALALIKKLFP